jgi:hypothetical protein
MRVRVFPLDSGSYRPRANPVPKQEDLRAYLMGEECAEVAQMVANLAF